MLWVPFLFFFSIPSDPPPPLWGTSEVCIRVWWFLVMLVVLAFVCGFLVVLVVLVVFSRAPWGTPYHQILMVVVVLVVCGRVFWGTHYHFPFVSVRPPRGSLGYPLSFPSTSMRFPPLWVLVVFGGFGVSLEVSGVFGGFGGFGWCSPGAPPTDRFCWLLVVVMVLFFLFVVFGGFGCFWWGSPEPLPPSL